MFGLGMLGNMGLVSGGGVPSWAPVADGFPADLAFDFTQNLAWTRSTGAVVPASSLLTCTRAISGTGHTYDYAANSLGVYSGFLANVPRMTDLGLLAEESRVNVVLNNRDLTQGTWTPSNITAAKDQVGVDGVANSASSIVATAGNGTILGATTVSSSARWQTAFVKRLVGSGTIQMTMDNGSTWTTITTTSSWSRVSIPTQTLANPTVGFKIVTNGDKIAVDFVQNEASNLFATSPIATTSATVTRNADLVNYSPTFSCAGVGTAFCAYTPIAPDTYGSAQTALFISDGTTGNSIRLYRISGTTHVNSSVGGATKYDQAGAGAFGASHRAAIAYSAGSYASAFDGSAAATGSDATAIPAQSVLYFGARVFGSQYGDVFLTKAAVWTSRLISQAGLNGITA